MTKDEKQPVPERIIIRSRPPVDYSADYNFSEPPQLREFGIKLGIPMQSKAFYEARERREFMLTTTNEPHIAYAQQITIQQPGKDDFVISGGYVMIGHGEAATHQASDWRFMGEDTNRYRVTDAIRAYEEYAIATGNPPLDVILVCRFNRERPSGHVRAKFESSGRLPYIYADNTVWFRAVGDNPHRCIPGKGIESLVVQAESWANIERWNAHWKDRPREGRVIPRWAVSPKLETAGN